MTGRDPAPSKVALAAMLVWVAALMAVFLLGQAPWWFELAAKKGLPDLVELSNAVHSLFSRNYLF